MSIKYEFDYREFKEIAEKMKNFGRSMEREINTILKKDGEEILAPEITQLIKTSDKEKGVHANRTKWYKAEFGNLEITIKAKGGAANKPGSFGYLVFPDEGRGPSNHVAQKFFERGVNKGLPKLTDITQNKLIDKLEEVL
ncbi:hypothetical protein [Lysinibacillus halotolerans]|nr:hypothetical protein [Lysinibacillus halotolerans]